MSPTTTTAYPLREAAEVRDPAVIGSLAETHKLWREALLQVVDLPEGHPSLEGFTPAEIEAELARIDEELAKLAALNRALAAPAAVRPTCPELDQQQIRRFLELLGKPGSAARVRAFLPKGHPQLDGDKGRKGAGSLPDVEAWQREGRGVYLVIGNGGDTDREITSCPALFIEHDDSSKIWQQICWFELGLPEPTMQVDTGGRSIHSYWVLHEPMAPDAWRQLQRRLLEHADADRSIKNPARVMRLPGTWHMGANGPNGMAQIIHESGHRYGPEQIAACLPEPEPAAPAAAAAPAPAALGDAVPLQHLLPRDQLQLWQQGAGEGGRNSALFAISCSLQAAQDAAALIGLPTEGSPEDAVLEFARRCCPPLDDKEALSVFRSAYSQPRTPDPGLASRLRFQLNRRHRQQHHQQAPARPQQPPEGQGGQAAAAAPAEARGMAWLLRALDTGMGTAGARKTTAGDLCQDLLLVAGDRLRFNEQTLTAEIDGEPIEGPALSTFHVELQLRGKNITAEAAVDALATAAHRRPYHPVREYLDRVAADDAIEPLDLTAMVGMFLRPGDPAGTLHGRMLAKTLIGAVARAYRPGCKLDTITVLVGEQGAQKSTFWEALAGPDSYSCSGLGNLDKDSLLLVHSCWLLEAAELEQITSKRAAGELKNFLSTSVDCFRVPYGRSVQRRPRPSIMVGTSNREDFLTDETGSRRFWIIPVTAAKIDVAAVRALRDRIWRSAVLAYRAGERWWLDRAESAASEMENQSFRAGHPWEAPVAAWLERQGPTPFCTIDCLTRARLRDQTQISRRDEMALATVLSSLGWKQERVRQGSRRIRLWVPAQPGPTGPTWPNLESERSGHETASDCKGSKALAQPAQPFTTEGLDAVPVGGTGTVQGEERKKGWATGPAAEIPASAVDLPGPTSPAEVGPRSGQVGPAPQPWHQLALQLRQEHARMHPATIAIELEQRGFSGVTGRQVAELLKQQEVER